MAIWLIAAPWLLNFARGGAESWVPVILGAGAVIYSRMTDYELVVFRTISIDAHLAPDLWSGILVASSPWLFGFYDWFYMQHLILGILEIAASLTTQRTTSVSPHGSEDHHPHAH